MHRDTIFFCFQFLEVQQPVVTQSQAETNADESNTEPSPEATVTTTTPDCALADPSNVDDARVDSSETVAKIMNPAEERALNEEYEERHACDTPRTGTPHEESDFEDNITVTVPPPQLQSNNPFRDEWNGRHMNGRHQRHVRPPGMETPPKNPHSHHV